VSKASDNNMAVKDEKEESGFQMFTIKPYKCPRLVTEEDDSCI